MPSFQEIVREITDGAVHVMNHFRLQRNSDIHDLGREFCSVSCILHLLLEGVDDNLMVVRSSVGDSRVVVYPPPVSVSTSGGGIVYIFSALRLRSILGGSGVNLIRRWVCRVIQARDPAA